MFSMRRILFVLLSCIAFLFSACSSEDYFEFWSKHDGYASENGTLEENVLKNDTLRILDIGNSYTEDYTYHLPLISKNLGDDMSKVCYYNLVRASGSFKAWYDCYYGRDHLKYYCQKILGGVDQNVPTGSFDPYDSEPFRQVLSKQWDLIILHPVSNYSTDYAAWQTTSAGGYLNELLSLLTELQPQAHFAFVLTHSYKHDYQNNREHSTYQRWLHIADAAQRLMASYPQFEYLIPYGTAVENLRATSANNEYDLTCDGTHLGRGLAQYAAALAVYQTIFYPRTGHSILNCTATYTCPQWEIDISMYEGSCIDVTAENSRLAILSAYLACEDCFRVMNPEDVYAGIRPVTY